MVFKWNLSVFGEMLSSPAISRTVRAPGQQPGHVALAARQVGSEVVVAGARHRA